MKPTLVPVFSGLPHCFQSSIADFATPGNVAARTATSTTVAPAASWMVGLRRCDSTPRTASIRPRKMAARSVGRGSTYTVETTRNGMKPTTIAG